MTSPAYAYDLRSASPPVVPPATEAAPRLLIVDDIADNRTLLCRRFEKRGFHVTEADGGAAALSLLERETFDLVLLDIMMPDIDGNTVLREIRTKHSSSTLPVIMVTARAMSDDIVQSLQLGADDYITKPVDFAVALARVNTQLARRRAELMVLNAANELTRNNEALEQRILERTRDLVRINEQLKEEITARERSEAATRYLAYHDSLTKLANRAMFRERVAHSLDQRAPATLLCIDLDGFKTVNDTLGHSIGDELLCEIAKRLKSIAPLDSLIARLGGDEFAVALPHANVTAASDLAAVIVDEIGEISSVQGREVRIGASVGIVFTSGDESDVDELMRNGDLAMYRAKAEGRGTWRVYNAEMDAAAQARRQLELDLRRALMVGDFRLYFQPILSVREMRITAFEALLRWDHAARGIVSPAEFLTVAEETGLIVPLGDWAIREACKFASTWPEDIRVAVNLSPTQLIRGNIVNSILSALATFQLSPSRFEIEITESALLERTAKTMEILDQLQSLGIRVSMDDFGTGYASLNNLRRFQFDKIKIDKSFVTEVPEDDDSKIIVTAITDLGNHFGLKTTAEGVETLQQLSYVRDQGCTEVQGYLFSMPVPGADVPKLIEKITDDWKNWLGSVEPRPV